jgi:hypothetical protein
VFYKVSAYTCISLTSEYIINYGALITIITSIIGLILLAKPLYDYKRIQDTLRSLNDLVVAVSEQARIGIRPGLAIQRYIELRAATSKDKFYEKLAARLSHGIDPRSALENIEKEVGFAPPKGIYRVFELLYVMERVGIEPESISRFASILLDVFALRQEARKKTRSAAALGLLFVVFLALLVAVIKVTIIDNLNMLRQALLSSGANLHSLPMFISPLPPEQQSIALLLTYYSTMLNAFSLGYIAGKTSSNNVIIATFFALLSTLLISIIVFIVPIIAPHVPLPRI